MDYTFILKNFVYVKNYRNGGHGSYDTFRIVWSLVEHPYGLDFRTKHTKNCRQRGLAGVHYVQGAGARDGTLFGVYHTIKNLIETNPKVLDNFYIRLLRDL